MDTQRIRRVVVLGGGTAGWMTAAALAKALPATIAITLIESEEIGTVGVGEATIPTIHWFNELIGLDEATLLRETGATFKLGIRFDGWNGDGSSYFHPFGRYGVEGGTVPFHQRWLKAVAEGLDLPLSAFSLAAGLAETNRFARPQGDARSILSTLGYAFHFDATRYGRHLRALAEAAGVTWIEGRFVTAERNHETGFVTALSMQDGRRIEGDLFVDCSGFRGLLIGETMGARYERWSHWLPCDRAVAVASETQAEPPSFTRAIARPAGWQWRIPLRHRTGNGHIYASALIDDNTAAQTLLDGLTTPVAGEPRFLRFTPGYRPEMWRANVVAIGLASGFLEPLESTSIHLIQSGIVKLITLFPDRDCDTALARRYNRLLGAEMATIRDFLVLHYHATGGREEPLWRDCQTMMLPDTLVERIDHYRRSGRLMLDSEELFREASWLAVLNGQGLAADGHVTLADRLDSASNTDQLRQIAAVVARAAPTLPRHAEAIAATMRAA